jgi:hypothetical protein
VSFTTDYEEIFDFGDAMDGRYFNVATKYVEFIVLLPHGEVLLDAEYKMKSYRSETLERISAAHLQLVTRHPFVTLPDGFDEETSPIFMYERLSAGEAKWNDFGWKPTEAWKQARQAEIYERSARGGRAVQEIHRANGTGMYDPDFHQRMIDNGTKAPAGRCLVTSRVRNSIGRDDIELCPGNNDEEKIDAFSDALIQYYSPQDLHSALYGSGLKRDKIRELVDDASKLKVKVEDGGSLFPYACMRNNHFYGTKGIIQVTKDKLEALSQTMKRKQSTMSSFLLSRN